MGLYRRLGLNQWPRSYEPRALPLRHPGFVAVFWCRLALTSSFFKAGELEFYRQQVSILWPSAYKAITISLSDVVHVEFDDRRCFRRSAAELCRYCFVWELFYCTSKIFLVLGTAVFSLVFRSSTHGIRTRNMFILGHIVRQLSHVHVRCELLGTSCSAMHIVRCRFLDDPPHPDTPLVSCKAWTQIITCCVIIGVKISPIYFYPVWWTTFDVFGLLNLWVNRYSNNIPINPSFHDILSTHVHAFFHLFSVFKHHGREKFKINNHYVYALIYWEMTHVMRNGSYIEDSLSTATNIIISFGTIDAFLSQLSTKRQMCSHVPLFSLLYSAQLCCKSLL